MRKIVLLLVLVALAWKGYEKYSVRAKEIRHQGQTLEIKDVTLAASKTERELSAQSFACDGRTYCSQMTSCEEATYFLQHCPDVKMDGNNDGIPCEKQWCK